MIRRGLFSQLTVLLRTIIFKSVCVSVGSEEKNKVLAHFNLCCISVVPRLMCLTSFQLKWAYCKLDPSGSILSYREEQHSDSILRRYRNDFRLAGVRDRYDSKVSWRSSTFTIPLTPHLAPGTHSSKNHTHKHRYAQMHTRMKCCLWGRQLFLRPVYEG